MKKCPYCDRTLAGEICPAHGFVGLRRLDKVVGPAGADGLDGADAVAGKIPSSYAELAAPIGTVSATFEPTGVETTITLDEAVEIACMCSFECATQSGASASTIEVAFEIDGTVHDAHARYLSGANDIGIGAIVHRTPEFAAGTYIVKLMFRRVSGVATPGLNSADMMVMAMQGAKGDTGATGATGPSYYTIPLQVTAVATLTDGQTLYGGFNRDTTLITTPGSGYTWAALTGTVKTCIMITNATGGAGSNENWSLYVMNSSAGTEELVQTLASTSQYRKWANYNMSLAVAQGQLIELKLVNPTWATNPTGPFTIRGYLAIEV